MKVKHSMCSEHILAAHVNSISKGIRLPLDGFEFIDVKSVIHAANTKQQTDTMVTVIRTITKNHTDKFTFKYNRQNIAAVLTGLKLTIPVGKYTTTADVIAAFNAKYGFNLSNVDVVVERLNDLESGDVVKVVMSPHSLVWKGEFELTVAATKKTMAEIFQSNVFNMPLFTELKRNKALASVLYRDVKFIDSGGFFKNYGIDGNGGLEQLATMLNRNVNDRWLLSNDYQPFNLRGAVMMSNVDNTIRLRINEAYCSNLVGELFIHY